MKAKFVWAAVCAAAAACFVVQMVGIYETVTAAPVETTVQAAPACEPEADRVVIAAEDVVDAAQDNVVEERILALPEDGGNWSLSLFTHPDWQQRPKDRYVVDAFQAVPELMQLKAQTHYHHWHPGHRLWSRYASAMTALPCIAVQDAAGNTVYKASGANIPDDPQMLVQHIRWMIGQRHAAPVQSVCPRPSPVQPPPTPMTGVPDLTPKATGTAADSDDLAAAVASGIAMLLAGVGYAARRS